MTGQDPVRPARPRPLNLALLTLVTVVASAAAFLGSPYAVRPLLGPPPAWSAGKPPAPLVPVLTGAGDQAPTPTTAGVASVLGPLLSVASLGGHVSVSVVDAASGQSLYAGQDGATVPASTAKVVTAATVLAALGPTHQLTTRAVAGANPGEVVLVGGGDPTLTAGANGTYPGAARLDDLAAQVRRSLGGTAPTKVSYDSSLFTGDPFGPGWDADIPTGGYGAAVNALTMDGARVNPREAHGARHPKPDLAVAQAFAKALGLPVTAVAAGTAAGGAAELGKVTSPPLGRIVEIMLSESDNVLAEALARQVAIAKGQPATFAGAAAAMKAVLGELGVPAGQYGLVDGSGLSRADRLSAGLLTSVLSVAARADNARLHALFSGLPVAGYSGTLHDRYRTATAGGAAGGNARAKTGTLTGVNAIAGIVVDADGRTLAFAVLADGVAAGRGEQAEAAIDRIVAALGGCGCR